jgi:predicted aldo/keto reductase-like oxidoreductase
VKPTSRQLEVIRERLQTLKNSALDLDRYDTIIQHFWANSVTYVDAAPFYNEIDSYIREELNEAQLKLVK